MGRPKGSGRGLVTLSIRVEPPVYQALETMARDNELTLGEAARAVLDQALLEQNADSRIDAGYNEGIRRGLREVRMAIQDATGKLWR